jgi:uncharacterized protein
VWFVFLALGLLLVLLGGLLLRARLGGALEVFGFRPAVVRGVRALVAWLLFGYPVLTFAAVGYALLSGAATMPRVEGAAVNALLVMPFFLSLLVMVQALPGLLLLEVWRLVDRWRARRVVGATAPPRLRAALVLALVGGFALYTPARIFAERDVLRLRTHEVRPRASASAAAAGPRLRIAFVADVQRDGSTDAAQVRRVSQLINGATPDLVLSGGDWINSGPDYIEAAADAAAELRSPMGTFSVRGDHEHFGYLDQERSAREVTAALQRRGVSMLADEVRWFEHSGKRIAVAFLNYNYIVRASDETIAALLRQLDGADLSIVVSHQIDERLAKQLAGKVDLVLGAHTHGGQVNPVLGVRHVPLARLETRYIDGRYQLDSSTVIVTAGVGFSIAPFRYASPGSLEIIDVRW